MTKMLKTFFLLNFLFSNVAHSNDIEPKVIVENCKSCHGEDFSGNSYIKSIKNLEKNAFIKKMKQYRQSEKKSVMSRIVKALSLNDIVNISDLIYEDK